jgi:2-polyprenyl-6-methoxyphenol hydroxylase-like FAD-dependent oxidoreductase
MISAPVLIVGGGPVGLTLALALSRFGVRSVLVNDRKETTSHPKLDVVNCRSMEIYRHLGIADAIRAAGNPVTANQYAACAPSASAPRYAVMSTRHLVYQPVQEARERIRACTDGSLPLEPMQRIAQMNLEPVLLAAARADANIDLRFGLRMFGFEQDEAGVTMLAQHVDTGENVHFRGEYLVGCDGPASRVRNFLNIDYDGTRDLIGELFIVHLRSNDIASLFPHGSPHWHTWLSRPGFAGLLVSPDASRNDYVIHRPFAPRPGESLASVVDAALGKKLSYEIVQSGPWRPQFLVARSFGRKRVYLAGDATHQYMPTGGLGMNTGVTEAHNLAWKLAARVQGWGGGALLASYEAERLPVARRNRDHVKKCAAAAFEFQFAMTADVMLEGATGDRARAALAAEFEKKVSRLYESLGAEIGYRYAPSPIVCPDDAPEPPCGEIEYTPTTWSGARLPSAFLDDGSAVFDRLHPRGFTLIVAGSHRAGAAPLEQAAREKNLPLDVLVIEEPRLARLYERRFVLVRPDQHVCWRADVMPPSPGRILDTVRGEG